MAALYSDLRQTDPRIGSYCLWVIQCVRCQSLKGGGKDLGLILISPVKFNSCPKNLGCFKQTTSKYLENKEEVGSIQFQF